MPIENRRFQFDRALLTELKAAPDNEDILAYGLTSDGKLVKPTPTKPISASEKSEWQKVVKQVVPVAGRRAIPVKDFVPFLQKRHDLSNPGWGSWFSGLLVGTSKAPDLEAEVSTRTLKLDTGAGGQPTQSNTVHLSQTTSIVSCLIKAPHAHDANNTLIVGQNSENEKEYKATIESLTTLLRDDPVNKVDLDKLLKSIKIKETDTIVIKLKLPNQLNLQYIAICPFSKVETWDKVIDKDAWESRYDHELGFLRPTFVSPTNQPIIAHIGYENESDKKNDDREGLQEASTAASVNGCMKWIQTLPPHSTPTIVYPPYSKIYDACKTVANEQGLTKKNNTTKHPPKDDSPDLKSYKAFRTKWNTEKTGGNLRKNAEYQPFYDKDKPYYSLTNFHRGADPIEIDGEKYPTTEVYFQCCKFKKNSPSWKKVKETDGASQTFRTAQDLFNDKNSDRSCNGSEWASNRRDQVMLRALRSKAEQDMTYRTELLSTGNRFLFEDSLRDNYWGVGEDMRGQNALGCMHMVIRGELLRNEIP